MDKTVMKIAIAAFMHDIGKMAEGALPVSEEYLRNNADLYQPFYQGHFSHRHAVYTAAFIESMEKILPEGLNRAHWGLEDAFVNLAAGHHKPETRMQWIIAIADRISSGWDRIRFEEVYNRAITPRDHKKVRLLPIFEYLMKGERSYQDATANSKYRYPLREISPENIFPGLKEYILPSAQQKAEEEYDSLFNSFVSSLEGLLHREENLQLWFEHFENLMMIHAANMPAARAGDVIPDVSLYDHLKTTSALAAALYLFHRESDTLSIEPIKRYDQKKFLLIGGDFYGIQSFIFSDTGESREQRSKMLRGRSFAVSLFSELAADMLCQEIGIPSICIVLNAAGKFTIVAPNTQDACSKAETIENRINDWFLKISYGENSMGISSIEASPQDFVKGGFNKLWEGLSGAMERKKWRKLDLNRYGGAVDGYLEMFRNDLTHPLCPLCGKRPADPEAEGSSFAGISKSACRICRDNIFLGSNLVRKGRIAISSIDADLRGAENRLLEPIFGIYQVTFADGEMREMARSGQLLKYWDISIPQNGKMTKGVSARFINAYIPIYGPEDLVDERLFAGRKSDSRKEQLINQVKEGVPKTFWHIARKALEKSGKEGKIQGIDALGVMKADVDHLGLLFSCGLQGEHFTISRIASLSRQLNWFFAVYLPHLLKTDHRFQDTYTVFAGGDDLFLIGPWNRMIELAGFLHDAFADYVCHNRKIHFSAGISLHKSHTPVDQLAEGAEYALTKSKDEGRNRVTLFSGTAEWGQFKQLMEIRQTLQKWLERGMVNNAMLYRLNEFIGMAEMEKSILKQKEIDLEAMRCLKWRALFHYNAARNVGKGVESGEKGRMIEEFGKAAAWLEDHKGCLRMALWDVLYNQRKEG